MIKVEIKGLKRAVRDLQVLAAKAIPHAARNALNSMAFDARSQWQGEIQREFTLRNKYTERSIRVDKASGTKIGSLRSVVGSVAPYMGDQEDGATVRGRGAHKAIPGPVAAGQAAGAKRTRVVRAGRRLSAIHVKHPAPKGDRKRRNMIAMQVARRAGNKVALLERPKGGKGLFLLGGGKRKITARLLWDVSRGSVKVPPTHTLQKSLKSSNTRFAHIQYNAVIDQLRRNRVFGY